MFAGAAIVHRIPALHVVAGGGGVRPYVAVAGDVAGIIKIIEHAELPRQLVMVGRNLLAVHYQRGVSVGFLDVAKDLIVGAVLLDDVQHMLDGVATGGEGKLRGLTHLIALHHLVSQRPQIFFCSHPVHARD